MYWIAALLLSLPCGAFEVPALTGPVMDMAGMLEAEDKLALERILMQTRSVGMPQIQVLTLNSLDGLPIEEASIRITDKWKLGGAKTDDGILFLIAKQERKMRIEVGQGLEGDLPDLYAKRIITDDVAPYFRQGHFSAGIVAGVRSILSRVTHDEEAPRQAPPRKKHSSALFFLQIFIVFIALMIRFSFGRRSFGSGLGGGGLRNRGAFGGFGGGGFGGSGGGGWSGGGGGFSGGGASGGW